MARFPVSQDGNFNYSRDNIEFTDGAGTGYPGPAGTGYPGPGGTGTAKEIADSIRDGEGVLVIYGLDYDGNGTYNFSNPEGASELNDSLPAEATDPALCGVLR